MKINQKIKYVSIVSFCIILAMIFHAMTSNYSTTPEVANWSFFVKVMGLPLTLIIWYFIAFGSIAFIFYIFESKLPGIKSRKGLRYGIAIGILWLWGMLEGVSVSGNPFMNEFITGISDALPIVLMGLLLGIFTTKRNVIENKRKSLSLKNILLSVFIFSTIFLVGRYFFYYTNIMKSGFRLYPYFTFIWTFLMGTCIGVTYLLLGQATKSSFPMISAIKFGVFIFGVNWMVFVIFIPFVFDGTLNDFIIRILIDTLLVILSYYISEFLGKMNVKEKKSLKS